MTVVTKLHFRLDINNSEANKILLAGSVIGKNYSQTCVQRPPWDPKIVAVVGKWSLFRGHLYNKGSKWDLKIVVVVDRWLLFGDDD